MHLEILRLPELRHHCEKIGVPKSGNKGELISRLVTARISYDNLLVEDLKDILDDMNLHVSGNKSELIARIIGGGSSSARGASSASEVVRGNQWPSEVIIGTPWQTDPRRPHRVLIVRVHVCVCAAAAVRAIRRRRRAVRPAAAAAGRRPAVRSIRRRRQAVRRHRRIRSGQSIWWRQARLGLQDGWARPWLLSGGGSRPAAAAAVRPAGNPRGAPDSRAIRGSNQMYPEALSRPHRPSVAISGTQRLSEVIKINQWQSRRHRVPRLPRGHDAC